VIGKNLSVSVCLASYCGARYISDQLDSVICQLAPGDELLVADDGSTDETLSILKRYGAGLTLVAVDRVGGVVSNFERVIAAATCDVVVLCDQDDVWLPGRLDLIREALQGCSLVVLNGQVVDADLHPSGVTVFESVGVRRGFFKNLAKNSFVGCCMAFRRELRDRVLPFPVGVPWHDWYIGLVAELLFSIERIDQSTLLYRRHGGNFSPTGEKSSNGVGTKILLRLKVLSAVLVACLFHGRLRWFCTVRGRL
jgi:glycosyltransferase involved in cell wall biosynthesis